VKVRTTLLVRQRADLESRVAQRTRELKIATQELGRLASQDGLTGIANRRHFDGVLDQELRRSNRSGEPLALLLIDVDDFKAYNDCYGHQAGDEVLRQVARLCQTPLRRVTDLAARYGGEEFAVILPSVGLSGAMSVANSIVAEIANARIAHRRARAAAHVTVSIGVSATDVLAESNDRILIASADAALYTAKEQGRNQAVAARLAPNCNQTDRAARHGLPLISKPKVPM
jgi:two-component system, sensor histidine kinase ChiS